MFATEEDCCMVVEMFSTTKAFCIWCCNEMEQVNEEHRACNTRKEAL